ncbi:MAG: hypothetical protein ACI9FU_001406 [Granulosicoccus sp.]|jgi:hypothetical protein
MTNTELKQEKIWDYLDSAFDFNKGIDVLVLNSGNGDDAIRFAQRGCRVTAAGSNKEALTKAKSLGLRETIKFIKLEVPEMKASDLNHQYDLVYSPVGGLNQMPISGVRTFQNALWDGLRSKGRFVGVLMPEGCMMETLHYFFRLQFATAFQRGKESIELKNANGDTRLVYPHSPRHVADKFGRRFETKVLLPIGFWLTPLTINSSEETVASGWRARLEERTSHPILAGISDTYLIDFMIKN